MPLKLTDRSFRAWIFSLAGLLALGTVLFPQLLWSVVPVIAGRGCVSGGFCGEMAAVLGQWLQPSLLLAAAWVGATAFYRRGLALGSWLWVLFPLALLLPELPAYFVNGSFLGVDLSTLLLVFPRSGLFELVPLLALGALLCFQVEYTPGFAGSVARTRLYGSIPVGLIYIGSCLLICSDLLLSLSPILGFPASAALALHDAIHFPITISGGEVIAGLPRDGSRPDLVVPLASLINLVSLAMLAFAFAFDESGRLRRAEQDPLGRLGDQPHM